MTPDDIERLIRRLERSDVTAITIADATASLTLRLAPAPAPREDRPPQSAAAPPVLGAPALGILRLRHPEAAAEPAPSFSRAVRAGEIVAFLEAGVGLHPVVAARDGTLGAPLLAEGSLVGYGAPLFPLL